jgi:2,3-bisphosphoglycerate-dependent phosphoglycerate mutase
MNDVTKICVTRHGETDWNVAQILQGWTDVPLNDTGRRQSYELADSLSAAGFSRVYSSPLKRASETAEIIAQVWKLPPPSLHEGLKERYFGIVQGKLKSELGVSHPGLHQEIMRRNPACQLDEGEPMDHFADRVLAALVEIGHRHPATRVLVITHGWVMDVITRHIKHLPRTAVLDMKRKNGESVWLEIGAGSKISESDES